MDGRQKRGGGWLLRFLATSPPTPVCSGEVLSAASIPVPGPALGHRLN